jgi:hypothetical protein
MNALLLLEVMDVPARGAQLMGDMAVRHDSEGA